VCIINESFEDYHVPAFKVQFKQFENSQPGNNALGRSI
jgi:hypothetical protein